MKAENGTGLEPGRRDGEGRPEFQGILDRSIEEGLRSVLGESGVQMVLSLHPLSSISADPARFHEAMRDIFLDNGAAIIEREIARRLLLSAGRERAKGRAHRSWLSATSFGSRSSARVSDREKRVLRKFVALASLPQGHRPETLTNQAWKLGRASSIELTSSRFAAAFKKGS
jgi:hypothetical protein